MVIAMESGISLESTCSEEGCDQPARVRGMCQRDYQRRWGAGTLPPIQCPVPECANEYYKKGPCKPHRAAFASAGIKWCTAPGCAEPLKPVSDFSTNGQGLYGWCKPCHVARTKKYHAANKGYPGSHHGLTPGQYRTMLAAQEGKCAICRKHFDQSEGRATTPCVDHDHSHDCPGKCGCSECVRALLCSGCNIMLGQAHDDPAILRRWKPTKKRPQAYINAVIAYLDYWHTEMAKHGIRPSLDDALWGDVFNAISRLVAEIA